MMLLFFILSVSIVVGVIGGISGIMWFRQHRLFLATGHYNNGVSHLESGDDTKAIREFKIALQRQKKLSMARYGLGLAYLRQQRYRESIDILEAALKKLPDDAKAYGNLGWAYLKIGDLDHAQQVLEKGLRLDPKIKELYFNLGQVFQERGDREKAIGQYQYALQIDANYVQARETLEELSDIHYDIPMHVELIRQALQNFDPNDTELMITL